jgi:hypothetical protein
MQTKFRTIAFIAILLAPLSLAAPLSAFQAEMAGAPVSIPSRFETACVQLMMDIDMLWHYTVEGESLEQAGRRVRIDKTDLYSFETNSPQEQDTLQSIWALHAIALNVIENILRGKLKAAKEFDETLEENTYASMRRGWQETFYHSCRSGVYFRLNTVKPG